MYEKIISLLVSRDYKLMYSKILIHPNKLARNLKSLQQQIFETRSSHWNFLCFLQNCLWASSPWGEIWQYLVKLKMQLKDNLMEVSCRFDLPEFAYCYCKQLLTCQHNDSNLICLDPPSLVEPFHQNKWDINNRCRSDKEVPVLIVLGTSVCLFVLIYIISFTDGTLFLKIFLFI